MIEWNDSMSIGVAEIDQQHRELVRRFNRFAEAVANGKTTKSLADILSFMRAYTIFHFSAEEKVMQKTGYADFSVHAQQHKEFIGKQFWLYECSRLSDLGVAQETADFLEKWIVEHVSVEDKKIGEFVKMKIPS